MNIPDRFLGSKYLNSLMRNRNPGNTSRIRNTECDLSKLSAREEYFNQIRETKKQSSNLTYHVRISSIQKKVNNPVLKKQDCLMCTGYRYLNLSNSHRIRTENIWDQLRNGKPKIISRNSLWIHNSVLTDILIDAYRSC
jgi:hypothetical protein